MTLLFIFVAVFVNSAGEDLLNKMALRYSKAPGIQWSLESVVNSPAFDETKTSDVQFAFNPPDTFYLKSNQEEVIGIADTVWVMSKQHHQIQKKTMQGNYAPSDFVLNWNRGYDIERYVEKNDVREFALKAHEGVKPTGLVLTVDRRNRIKRLSYKDSSGDDVALTIKREKLKRSSGINLFYQYTPRGYKLIDLTD